MSETEDKKMFALTPKGVLVSYLLERTNATFATADVIWNDWQAFCMRRLRCTDPDAEYPAIVMDGEGGTILGVNKGQ